MCLRILQHGKTRNLLSIEKYFVDNSILRGKIVDFWEFLQMVKVNFRNFHTLKQIHQPVGSMEPSLGQ